jgi:hypothetical protein
VIVRNARKALTSYARTNGVDLTTVFDEGDIDAGGPMAHIDAIEVVLVGVYGIDHERMVEVTQESVDKIECPERST